MIHFGCPSVFTVGGSNDKPAPRSLRPCAPLPCCPLSFGGVQTQVSATRGALIPAEALRLITNLCSCICGVIWGASLSSCSTAPTPDATQGVLGSWVLRRTGLPSVAPGCSTGKYQRKRELTTVCSATFNFYLSAQLGSLSPERSKSLFFAPPQVLCSSSIYRTHSFERHSEPCSPAPAARCCLWRAITSRFMNWCWASSAPRSGDSRSYSCLVTQHFASPLSPQNQALRASPVPADYFTTSVHEPAPWQTLPGWGGPCRGLCSGGRRQLLRRDDVLCLERE